MIKLLVLEGCNKCQKLKDALTQNNIKYSTIVCMDDTSICDEVEDLTGCYVYPMVLYVDDFNSITNIFYVTDKYDEVGKLKSLSIGTTSLAFHSIDQLINYIIK